MASQFGYTLYCEGPDPDRHTEAVRAYLDAGYEHVAVAYPGNDPGGFMQFWNEELRPHLQ